MQDWSNYLDDILKMNRLDILGNAWKISKEKMEKIVEKEIIKYQEKWWSLDIYIETIQEIQKLNSSN
jgi:hypothetical protein